MVKTKMSYSKLMKQPHYKSIMNLTLHFQGENGLQYKHYVYALQKNHGISETSQIANKFEVKGEKLKHFYKSGNIVKDCIKPGKSLDNFLRKLVYDYGYLEISNPGEKYRRYKISLLPFMAFLTDDIIIQIEEYPLKLINNISDINFETSVDTQFKSYFIGGIFGFPNRYEKYVSENDYKEINKSLINIYKELNKINNIKLKYMEGDSHFSFYGKVIIVPDPEKDKLIKEFHI